MTAIQTVVFVSRILQSGNIVNTIGIQRQTARSGPVGNAYYILRRCPALVCVFCDINKPKPVKTKGVAIRRDTAPGFPLVRPGITDQPRGKDLSRGPGWGLSQIRPLGNGLFRCLDGITPYYLLYKRSFFQRASLPVCHAFGRSIGFGQIFLECHPVDIPCVARPPVSASEEQVFLVR